MKRGMLCSLLVLACSLSCTYEERPWLGYALTWTCLSLDGCERAEQIALVDRLSVVDDYDLCGFWSTRDGDFAAFADLIPSDSLPPDCYWLTSLTLFAHELEQSQICFTGDGFTVEVSIPDRDPPTQSKWRIGGRFLGRVTLPSVVTASRGSR
ncbi:MAG TPA: hypothetical protein VNM90_29760 [Haliangium sp.]|nr:hypothetical protein [Haliangium sp.]